MAQDVISCYIYTRRSRDDPLTLSVESQEEQVQKYLSARGLEYAGTWTDPDDSGRSLNRPQLREMLAKLTSPGCPVKGIAIRRLDRLCRKLRDWFALLEVFEKHGIALICLDPPNMDTSTALGRAVLHVLLAFAELEADMVGERIKESNAKKVAMGRFAGGSLAFGYAYDKEQKRIVEGPRAEDARKVFRYFIASGGSTHATVRRLNMENVPSPRGSIWTSSNLLRLLRAPLYRGMQQYDKTLYPVEAPRIISQDDLAMVDSLLKPRSNNVNQWRANPNVPLSGLLTCGICLTGRMYRAGVERIAVGGRPRRYPQWRCHRSVHGGCGAHSVSERRLEVAVARQLAEALRTKLGEVEGYAEARPSRAAEDLERRREALERRKARCLDLFKGEYVTWEQLQQDLAEIDRAIAALPAKRVYPKLESDDLRDWLTMLASQDWYDQPEETRRRIYLALINRGWVITQPLKKKVVRPGESEWSEHHFEPLVKLELNL